MFKTFQDSFIPGLEGLEYAITVIVHAIIPLSVLAYSIIYLVNDPKASTLKEMFVLKGIMYPAFYAFYYVLISMI